jgi:2-keto-4-pentenoate hydratase/2-oxohepta-3-ene-1,7-dioic acid hydratase in catechol pathway
MKLASYVVDGRPTWGAVIGDGLLDLGPAHGATLRAAIAAGALPAIARQIEGARAQRPLSSVAFLPTITDADKIVCIGKNYRAHVAEGGGKPLEFPSVFIRFASSQVGHAQAIRLSKLSSDYDYEGELALVIGTGGRHIARERALSHIAGYVCFNEACYRDFQFKHSLTVGKNFAASGAFGPWMTTADEIPDPSALELTTRLNGVQVQHASVSELIFDVPYLVSYLSGIMRLVPGDVIVTGTPEGVGFARTPPLWMKAGDEVEVEISKIGVLRNRVEKETSGEES